MFKTLLLAGVLSATAIVAHAAERIPPAGEPQGSIVVSTAGVNFGDPQQVKAFHGQLWRKAFTACASLPGAGNWGTYLDRICARDTLDRAVAAAGQPLLTSFNLKERAGLRLASR